MKVESKVHYILFAPNIDIELLDGMCQQEFHDIITIEIPVNTDRNFKVGF
jgi:hypothetical protein